MLKRNRILSGALGASLALAGSVAASADIIAYRTDDGVFAYTDDREKVPARYAADAVTVPDSRLNAYPRLTIEDTEAARAVSLRLEKRLDYLRQVNAATSAERQVAATAAGQRTIVSVATGSSQVPTLDIPADPAAGPIIVEPIITKQGDRVRTRRATVVKQGDQTLAIVKGRSHHVDINSDIHDEDALLEQARAAR
jgi:hypothetical protein